MNVFQLIDEVAFSFGMTGFAWIILAEHEYMGFLSVLRLFPELLGDNSKMELIFLRIFGCSHNGAVHELLFRYLNGGKVLNVISPRVSTIKTDDSFSTNPQ